jgi:hypothetical protein
MEEGPERLVAETKVILVYLLPVEGQRDELDAVVVEWLDGLVGRPAPTDPNTIVLFEDWQQGAHQTTRAPLPGSVNLADRQAVRRNDYPFCHLTLSIRSRTV